MHLGLKWWRRAVLVAASLVPTLIMAQTPEGPATTPGGAPWDVGVSISVPGYRSSTVVWLSGLTITGSSSTPGRLGAELSASIVPIALLASAAMLHARANVTLPQALGPGVLLVPSAGVSGLGGIGSNGASGVYGLNVGGALVFTPEGDPVSARQPAGVRIGLSVHSISEQQRYTSPTARFWLLEFGLVHRSGSSRAR